MSTLSELTAPKVEQTGPAGYSEFVYVDISSIDNQAKRIVDPKRLKPEAAPSRARQRLRKGDVLVSMTRPNLNAVAIVPADLDGAIGSTGFHVLRAKDDVEPHWLYYAVQSSSFVKAMCDLVQGALYPAVRPKDIREYQISPPPLAMQREIVAELEKQFSRLDEAVANLQRVKANLKRYKDSVYSEAFRNAPNSTLGELIEAGPQNGLYLPKDMYGDGVPILRIDDYQTAWIRPVQELRRVKSTQEQISTWALCEGDLVVNRVNSMTHLGKCVRIPKSLAGAVFESNMMRMRLTAVASPKYVEHYLASRLGKKRLTGNAKWAVNQASINQKDVRATPIFIPDLATQLKVVTEVDRHLSILREVEAEVDANLQRAQALRQSVLKKAFSGELSLGLSQSVRNAASEAMPSKALEPAAVVMAARIIAAHCHEPTFGRVRLQKQLHLATYIAQVATNDEYARKQAGPLDMTMLSGVTKRVNDLGWFRETERADKVHGGKAYGYSALIKADEYKQHLNALTPAQQKVIDELIRLMRNWTTERCELFSTVYAAWNDLILWNRPPTEQAVIDQVLSHWHESKKKFSAEKIAEMMHKIKDWGYTPLGFGRPTLGETADTVSGDLFPSQAD